VSELTKTLVYAGVGLLFVAAAFIARPRDVAFSDAPIVEQVKGKPLFEAFKDPADAARLEIVRVDGDLGQLHRFEVARDRKSQMWTIPSHNGYPADAENQMRDASVLFIDLPVLDVVSTIPEDHNLFGVLEPSDTTASMSEGVGILISVENQSGDPLAQLIIGKPVKNSQDLRFVRKPGQDYVYVAKIDPSKLSTKFEDWIEKDLLLLSSFDIDTLKLFDYSVFSAVDEQGRQVAALDQRMQVNLNWDATKSEWNLKEMFTFKEGQPIPSQMTPDQQLNNTRLNELKTELDNLQIVDVHRKPAGMGADLRADKSFFDKLENVASLVEKGFYPERNSLELKSANGEIHVGMKDGVEYVLRFGNSITGTGDKVNRYLFVTARFDESKFPLPEKPAGLEAAPPATSPPGEIRPADAPPADAPRQDDPPPANHQDNPPPPPACDPQERPDDQPPPPAAETPAAETPAAETPAAETPAAETGGQSPQPPTGTQPAGDDEAQAAAREQLQK
jgi:hypothetical protein